MITQTSPLTQLLGLSESDRLAARDVARENVIKRIGPRPERSQFEHHTASKYPAYVTRLITGIMVILLISAFLPSSFRVFRVASDTFGKAITDTSQRAIVGAAFVLLAEAAVIGFSLAAGVLDISKRTRRLLYSAAGAATLIAVIGNIQIAVQHTGQSFDWLIAWLRALENQPFGFLEAVAPPLLTLVAALVLKEQALDSVAARHANERAFQAALADWKAATSDPEMSPTWSQTYANALKHKLVEVNGRGRGQADRREIMAGLTPADWRALVYRELQADSWYDTAQPDQPVALPVAAYPAPRDPQWDQEVAVHPLELVSPNGHNGNGTHG